MARGILRGSKCVDYLLHRWANMVVYEFEDILTSIHPLLCASNGDAEPVEAHVLFFLGHFTT